MERLTDYAIILRKTPFSEADVMLTLYTQRHGKLRVLAKGARRSSSRLVGHTEPFSVIQGQINTHSKIPLLSQVTIEYSIAGLAEDPVLIQRISLLAEVVDKSFEEGEANEAIYALLVEGTLRLRHNYQPMLFIGLLLRLLGLLGYAPEITTCVVCKTRLEAGGRYGWNHGAGGVVANDCLKNPEFKNEPVASESLKALRFLQRQPIAGMERLQTPPEVVDQLHDLVINYARFVLERPIVSANVTY
jgi:DNA repair protein RecO (recombination protein O)